MASLNTIKRTARRAGPKVGRGGKRGKTAGRGTKGQNARAGHRKRPELRDIIKKYPKRRGYGKNRARTVNTGRVKPVALSAEVVAKHFAAGETVSPRTVVEKGIMSARGRKFPVIKIVGTADLPKVTVENCVLSASARAAFEKAGSTIA